MHALRRALPLLVASALLACGPGVPDDVVRVTFSGSAVGAEGEELRRQLDDFMRLHPEVHVEILPTPDVADQRHQLYVQWLNARTPDPDILQLDVIWTAEFAAAGWILPIEPSTVEAEAFFPAALEAATWRDTLYAIPLFLDVGMLYWRTDLLERAPRTYEELGRMAADAAGGAVPYGYVWQGARYEGLVVNFLEHVHAFGGRILDDEGGVTVDRAPAVRALTFMRDAVRGPGPVPEVALTWREEETRFAFQNGRTVFMRNWPYAYPLLGDSAASAVAGRFAVAPLPDGPGGRGGAAVGGALLAINAHSGEPEAARRVAAFLTDRERMLARAHAVGQYPARRDAFDRPDELARALAIPPGQVLEIVERAVPRPVSPVYPQLSSILQVWLHRALTGQAEPEPALRAAAAEMRTLLARLRLLPGGGS